MDLEQVATRLYRLPPEDFTAARDADAKAAGDRATRDEIRALRRPTVAAWLVNLLAHDEPALLDQLLELGAALAEAQSSGRPDDLRALGEQRRALVQAVTGRAVELAGRDVPAGVRADVESTLEAALADPRSADAVRTGRLVRALSFAGFGGVDLDGAVSGPAPAKGTAPKRGRPGTRKKATRPEPVDAAAAAKADAVAKAEAAALDAAAALDDAVRACETAEQETAAATDEATAADAEVREHEAALEAARERRRAARRAVEDAERRARRAVEAVRAAQDRAERSRTALDKLRRAGTR